MMRHVLAALFLPFLLMMVLLCPARALAATGEQELELASSLVAMASYSDELSLLAREWLTETGWQFQSQTTSTSLAQGRYHLVVKELPDGRRTVLLAFPGTENVSDAKVDLRTVSVPFGGSKVEEFRTIAEQDRHATAYPLVHKGFDDYTMTALFHDPIEFTEDGGNKAVGQTMGEALAAELREHPEEILCLTGHSLGGAAAILTAARLSDMGVRPEQLRVITFGSPAVGNTAFARRYEKRMQLTRIVVAGDPVAAALQSLGTRYVQFGARTVWKQDRSSARFEHEMIVYLDKALRHYLADDGADTSNAETDDIAWGYWTASRRQSLAASWSPRRHWTSIRSLQTMLRLMQRPCRGHGRTAMRPVSCGLQRNRLTSLPCLPPRGARTAVISCGSMCRSSGCATRTMSCASSSRLLSTMQRAISSRPHRRARRPSA